MNQSDARKSLLKDIVYLRLYIADDAPNSVQAVANITAICEEYLKGRYDLKIVDVLKNPEMSSENGIILMPTLVRVSPQPILKIKGNLSEKESVLKVLGLM